MLKLRKPNNTEASAPALSAYQIAKRRWAEIVAKRRELVGQLEGLQLAVSFARHPGDSSRVPDELKAKAAPFKKLAAKRPAKIEEAFDEIQTALDALMATYPAERETWERARRIETSDIATRLQPAHREAVREIGAALELLSKAITAEREIRTELEKTAPLPSSPYLPDMSANLLIGTFLDVDSPMWRWRKMVHRLGILKD